MYGLSIDVSTVDLSKSQGQGFANFDNEYLENGERYGENYYCHQITSHVWHNGLSFGIYAFDLELF